MIVGLGHDLAAVCRIERALSRFGLRFVDRVFASGERARAERRVGRARAASYARVFAAKEACAKALGTGIGREGVRWA